MAGEKVAEEVTFLNKGAGDVHPAVGVLGINLRHQFERPRRALQIALQEQPDAVIIPAAAVIGIELDHLLERLAGGGFHRDRHGGGVGDSSSTPGGRGA